MAEETAKGAVYIETRIRNGEWREAVTGQPVSARAVQWVEQQLDLSGIRWQHFLLPDNTRHVRPAQFYQPVSGPSFVVLHTVFFLARLG